MRRSTSVAAPQIPKATVAATTAAAGAAAATRRLPMTICWGETAWGEWKRIGVRRWEVAEEAVVVNWHREIQPLSSRIYQI